MCKEDCFELIFFNKSLFDEEAAKLHFRHRLVHVARNFQLRAFQQASDIEKLANFEVQSLPKLARLFLFRCLHHRFAAKTHGPQVVIGPGNWVRKDIVGNADKLQIVEKLIATINVRRIQQFTVDSPSKFVIARADAFHWRHLGDA
ncbi:MAG: hypothetical protein DKT66_14315 [Candidatus Melainabacteria bacterium]|nr:MAG: hypothetical protein DKT66_14315 [Candidatus Melainabacteria bacterium]